MRKVIGIGLVLGLTLAATAAFSATTVKMDILRKTEFKVNGVTTTTLTPIHTAIPGEKLVYRVTLSNTDPSDLKAVNLVVPVDKSLTLFPNSVTSSAKFSAKFSADGNKTFSTFANLKVRDGSHERAAKPSDITGMKVNIADLPAKGSFEFEYTAAVH